MGQADGNERIGGTRFEAVVLELVAIGMPNELRGVLVVVRRMTAAVPIRGLSNRGVAATFDTVYAIDWIGERN